MNQSLGHHENGCKSVTYCGTLSLHYGYLCKFVIFGGLDFVPVYNVQIVDYTGMLQCSRCMPCSHHAATTAHRDGDRPTF